jgi:hypothetical protein
MMTLIKINIFLNVWAKNYEKMLFKKKIYVA